MTALDLDAVLRLAEETEHAPQWTRDDYNRILLSDPSALFYRFAMVADAGTTLAGFAVASVLRSDDIAELETIVVRQELRRLGIGRGLLEHLMLSASLAPARAIRLEVRPSNVAALALYFGRGFRKIGVRPSYYSAPIEDALLLEADLTELSG